MFALATGFSVMTPSPALASGQTGNVTYIALADSRILFQLTGSRTARPGCDCCDRWEVSATTDQGRAILALLMTARAQGTPVEITGTGSCVAGSNDTEGVNYIQFN